MFYNPQTTPVTTDVPVGGISLTTTVDTTYYQIYEDGRPLNGMAFATIKEARQQLRSLLIALTHASFGWFTVTQRLPYMPVRNTLGVVKSYGDGSSVRVMYTIRPVVVQSVRFAANAMPSAGQPPHGVAGRHGSPSAGGMV